ncbi:MAG: hypothetical protein V9G98_09315, partial [Candidatus Competibacter sp.]
LSGLGLTIKLSRRRQERLVRRFEASAISKQITEGFVDSFVVLESLRNIWFKEDNITFFFNAIRVFATHNFPKVRPFIFRAKLVRHF